MFISVAIFVQHQHAIELKLQDFARFDEAELIEIDLATNLYKENVTDYILPRRPTPAPPSLSKSSYLHIIFMFPS